MAQQVRFFDFAFRMKTTKILTFLREEHRHQRKRAAVDARAE
jgi:hypothetical protein